MAFAPSLRQNAGHNEREADISPTVMWRYFANRSNSRNCSVTRECVLLEAERSMSGAKVAEALQRVIEGKGAAPESITCDNGTDHRPDACIANAIATAERIMAKIDRLWPPAQPQGARSGTR